MTKNQKDAFVVATAQLAAKMGFQVRGIACPECGDPGPHDSNGDPRDPTMCCYKCGAMTDADYFEVG